MRFTNKEKYGICLCNLLNINRIVKLIKFTSILNLIRTYLTNCALPPIFWAAAASYAA